MESRKAHVAMYEGRTHYYLHIVFTDVNNLIKKINVQMDRHGLEAPVVDVECPELNEDEIIELQHAYMSVINKD